MHPLINQAKERANLIPRLLEMMPDVDEETLTDTLDGLNDFPELLSWMVRLIGEEQASVEGLKVYIGELTTRKQNAEARIDRMKSVVMEAMEIAGDKSVKLPEATLSVRKGQPKLVVTDEYRIPDTYYESVPKRLDAHIKSDLIEGVTVPGAELSNSPPSLTIRRK